MHYLPPLLWGIFTHALFHYAYPSLIRRPVTTFLIILSLVSVLLSTQTPWDEDGLLYLLAFPISIATSVAAYRISPFRPLAGYPGPVLARVSKLWAVWHMWRGRQHHVIIELHQRYGTFVRIGPNDLSIADVKAVTQVLGASGLPKEYTARKNPKTPNSLFTMTGEEHANRRRLWNRGMSNESLKNYEPDIAKRSDELVHFLKTSARCGNVDLNRAVGYFTFDFMGDMAFGKSFDMLTSRDTTGLWGILERYSVQVYRSLRSELVLMTSKLPILSDNLQQLRNFAFNAAMGRLKAGTSKKDLWYHLSDEAGLEKQNPPVIDVAADAILAIIAGSDTTASALASFFYCILNDKASYKRLQKEIDSVYPPGADATECSLHDQLVYLDACLNETLRIFHLGRRTVPVSRSLSNALETAAFIPFSYGPANCGGRNLARLELKMVIIALMRELDFDFADGFAAQEWPDTILDYLVTFRAPFLST
ncbi:cytochrome P450 [Cerioporus squamosus]|nr:cytochrome P450 [Cerioporus squamosus]